MAACAENKAFTSRMAGGMSVITNSERSATNGCQDVTFTTSVGGVVSAR